MSAGKFGTVFIPAAQAELRHIDRTIARRILAKLAELENDPYAYGTTELTTQPGVRRLRATDDYRVLYQVQGDVLVICVIRVAHRSEVY